MNNEDYKKYKEFECSRIEFRDNYISKYNEDVLWLEKVYKDDLDKIKQIDYIIKNKKTSMEIINQFVLIFFIEIISWIPFIISKNGNNYLGTIIPIMFIIFANLMIITLYVTDINKSIYCTKEYRKLIK